MGMMSRIVGCCLACSVMASGEIVQKLWKYDYSGMPVETLRDNAPLRDGFAMSFRVGNGLAPGQLVEVPKSFRLECVERGGQTYYERDGKNPALRATIWLTYQPRPKWKSLSIELPLNALGDDWSKREIGVLYDQVNFLFTVDGVIIDRNYPVGTLDAQDGSTVVKTDLLQDFRFSPSVAKVSRTKVEHRSTDGIQFYTPYGHNTWCGDVVVYYKDGLFHLLYLFDRNHHGSRWGCGAHIFHHMTTRDLVNWVDHGPILELTEQWQSVGTGTMVSSGGKLLSVFGWHTTRTVDYAQTVSSQAEKYLGKNPVAVSRKDFAPLVPSGTTYAESEDGLNFTWSEKFLNVTENPSIFEMSDGSLKLFGSSRTWSAPGIDGPWTLVDSSFPVAGKECALRSTFECPSYFEFNGYRYLLMGFTGMWAGKGEDGPYVDKAAEGLDIYDGLGVPFVAPYHDGRRILAGWPNRGWASVLLLREVISYPDGNLGLKWVPELAPKRDVKFGSGSVSGRGRATIGVGKTTSVYGEVTVTPSKPSGRLAIRFRDQSNPSLDVEFQIDLSRKRAQINGITGDDFAAGLPTAREIAASSDKGAGAGIGANLHCLSRNFCLENVRGLEGEFVIRFVLRRSKKLGAAILDVEIAGCRTMVSIRPGAKFDKIELAGEEGISLTGDFFKYPEEGHFDCGGK